LFFGPKIVNGVFTDAGGRTGSLTQNWADNPAAAQLHDEIKAIWDRISEFKQITAQVQGGRE
jgi:hypothetical protein